MRISRKPQRGEIYWVDFSGEGHEQRGRRPALIVQNDRGNENSPVTNVVILTTAPARPHFRFMVQLHAGEANLNRDSSVNCSHIYTVDQGRLDGYVGVLSTERMKQVDEAIRFQLGL